MNKPFNVYAAFLVACVALAVVAFAEPGVTLKSGRYEMLVSGKYAATVRRIAFDGAELATPTGFYNTVIAAEKGKFIGGGHREGGEEAVLSVEFVVDGEKRALETGQTATGERIEFRKVSQLANLKLHTEIILTPDGIQENKRFEATADQPLHLAFLYLYCWAKNTTHWLAETASGQRLAGAFDGSMPGKTRWHLQQDAKWAAVYCAGMKAGMVTYFPEVIAGRDRRSSFWEVKGAYNKYYLMLDHPPVIRAGYRSPEYKALLKGFRCETAQLDATVAETVATLDALTGRQAPVARPTSGGITFSTDYTGREMDSADAQSAAGSPQATAHPKGPFRFDFDTMAHTNRGLQVGDDCPAAVYGARDSLPPREGSVEMVVKAGTWPWNDEKVHVFFQTVHPGGDTSAKLYLYKYKTSGLAAYFEPDRSGAKAYLNCSAAKWANPSWHHMLFTWSAERVAFYVDGRLCKAQDMKADITWPDRYSVGPYGKLGAEGKSTVSNLTLFNRALTAAEAAALAKERLPELKTPSDAGQTTAILGEKRIAKPSPWFQAKPRLALDALKDDAVLPPWTPVQWGKGEAAVWKPRLRAQRRGPPQRSPVRKHRHPRRARDARRRRSNGLVPSPAYCPARQGTHHPRAHDRSRRKPERHAAIPDRIRRHDLVCATHPEKRRAAGPTGAQHTPGGGGDPVHPLRGRAPCLRVAGPSQELVFPRPARHAGRGIQEPVPHLRLAGRQQARAHVVRRIGPILVPQGPGGRNSRHTQG